MTPSLTTPEEEERAPEQASEISGRTELPLAVAISVFLFLAFLVVPMAGLLTLPMASVPMVRLVHRRGFGFGLIGVALTALALWIISAALEGSGEALRVALLGGIVVALPAFFAGAVRAGRDASLAYLGLCLAGFLIFGGSLLIGPGGGIEETARVIDRTFDEVLAAPAPGTRPEFQAWFAAAREFTKQYWFGLIGVGWFLGAALSFYTGAWAARPAPSAEQTRFESLRIPAFVAPLFVATGAAFALAPPYWARISANLLWPLTALYFVGGLSIICCFARRWFRSRLLRIGLYALVVYVPITAGTALLGLFDWYTDFRKRGQGATKTL
jgi:hypothetical protein